MAKTFILPQTLCFGIVSCRASVSVGSEWFQADVPISFCGAAAPSYFCNCSSSAQPKAWRTFLVGNAIELVHGGVLRPVA
jgi:hypothetical protein